AALTAVTLSATVPLAPALKVMLVVPCPFVIVPLVMFQLYVVAPPNAAIVAVLFVDDVQTCAGTLIGRMPGAGAGQTTVKLNEPVSPPPSLTLIVFAPVDVALMLNVCAPLSPATNV